MTPSQWSKLRRGDILRHRDHPSHFHTIHSIRNGAVMMLIVGLASDPNDWIQVNEFMIPIDEYGNPLPPPEPNCRMCDGAGAAHYDGAMQICPRCAGQGKEPEGIVDQVVEMRIFYPKGAEFPQVIFTAETELHHGQVIELLTRALQIMKGQTSAQFKDGSGKGMVS